MICLASIYCLVFDIFANQLKTRLFFSHDKFSVRQCLFLSLTIHGLVGTNKLPVEDREIQKLHSKNLLLLFVTEFKLVVFLCYLFG